MSKDQTFEEMFAEEIKQAEKEVAEMIEAESKKPFEMPTQQEIDADRQYWLKEKTETNSVISIVCLGILKDFEKITKERLR